jgi:hypothetical protein
MSLSWRLVASALGPVTFGAVLLGVGIAQAAPTTTVTVPAHGGASGDGDGGGHVGGGHVGDGNVGDTGDDADFLAELGRAGITYSDTDRAVAAGKAICDQMDGGKSAADLVENLTDVNPGFTRASAVKFTVIAAGTYCPKYLTNS